MAVLLEPEKLVFERVNLPLRAEEDVGVIGQCQKKDGRKEEAKPVGKGSGATIREKVAERDGERWIGRKCIPSLLGGG
ncbi:MAG: hypothetical protein ABIN58_01395 [candidate division WOR-3 bacterium]